MSYTRLSAKRADVAIRNKVLQEAHSAVGEHRTHVEAIIDSINDEGDEKALVSVGFASSRVAINAFGVDVDNVGLEAFNVVDDLRHPVAGAVPGNKKLGNTIIPCGVCLIVGPGGVGKTPLAHALAAHGGVDYYGTVRIGEPLAGYTSNEKASATAIAQSLIFDRDIVVDSIKDLLAAGSNAMRAGITRQSLVTLSEWSTTACDMGSTMYIPVNPSSVSEEIMDLLAEAARSNATSTLVHDKGNRWLYYGRTGEGQPRVHAMLYLNNDGTVSVDGAPVEVSESRASVAIVGALDRYKGAIRRSLILDEQDGD